MTAAAIATMSRVIHHKKWNGVDDFIETLEKHRNSFQSVVLVAMDKNGDIYDQQMIAGHPFTMIGALDMVRHEIQEKEIEHGNGTE